MAPETNYYVPQTQNQMNMARLSRAAVSLLVISAMVSFVLCSA